MSDLPALLERMIRAATGPDQEIDEALAYLDGWEFHGPRPARQWSGHWVRENQPHYGSYIEATQLCDCEAASGHEPPAYTASLDAALALCERKLPGWSWWIGNADTREDDPHDRRATPRAILKRGETTSLSVHEKRWFDGHAATPALALLSALVSALASASTVSSPERSGD